MSKISSYPSKPVIDGSDIVIGTSASNGQTKNFSIAGMSYFAINTWLSNISWQFVIVGQEPVRAVGTISFENFGGQSTAWSAVTKLYINTLMPNGTASVNYLSRLVGKSIILGDRNNLDGYGIFTFDSLTQESGTAYSMSLTYESGSGVMNALHYYGIQVDAGGIEGDKNYVFPHNQSVAAVTWNVQHNLNKFPSCTMVLSTGQQGYGDVTFIDENNLTITFASAETGKAYIN